MECCYLLSWFEGNDRKLHELHIALESEVDERVNRIIASRENALGAPLANVTLYQEFRKW